MVIDNLILEDHAFLREFRQDIHKHPELAFNEVRTSQCVAAALSSAGIEFVAGLAKGTGILAWLPATKEGGKTIALRADMDALPIHEETELPYSSVYDGIMHACGHDGHTSVLVGVARYLVQQTERVNNILLVFQPAEEGGGGGRELCLEGAMAGKIIGEPVDAIYGLHGWPSDQEGLVFTKNGPMMAASDDFKVYIRGEGGHAAAPHLSKDPIIATAQIITALQSIGSRNVDPTDSIVFTVGMVNGGTAGNVIPDSVMFKGTMRTLQMATRSFGKQRFVEIVEGIAQAMGVKAEIEWKENYPVTANNAATTERFREIARDVLGPDRVFELAAPVMGAEDFSYYGYEVPATFFFVGMRRPDQESAPLVHTPRFDFNDEIIPDCVQLMSELALRPLDN